MVADRDFTCNAPELRAYAQRLLRAFQTLGTLADSGVAVRRDHHVAMSLRPVAARHRRSVSRAEPAEPSGDAARELPPQPESHLLEEWCWESWDSPERYPLLIVGPLGAGKSVALESFAYRLAVALDRWAATPSAGNLPPVPLPVRLRALRYAEGEAERFREFLVRSQEVLVPSDNGGLLSASLVNSLLDAGAVVCLLDGLDELPGLTEFGDIRRRVMDAAAICCGGFFIVTSRPGRGADGRINRQVQVELLDERTALGFVRARVGIPANVAHPALSVFSSYPAHVRAMLCRPLFLAAWCERIRSDPGNPPRRYDETMLEFYLHGFDDRRAALRLSGEEQLALRAPLGAVLKVFADGNFSTRTEDELRSALAKEPGFDGAVAARVIEVALGLDLMTRVGRSAYLVHGGGPTEYLVARYLADLISHSEVGARHFVRTFQRWAWMPSLYGLLESTFTLMAAETSEWPTALVGWLTAVDAAPRASNDLLHPFAALGLRLALAANQLTALDESTCGQLLDALVPPIEVASPLAAFVPLDYATWLDDLLPPNLPAAMANALMAAMIGRRQGTETTFEERRWEILRDVLAQRVRSDEAMDLAECWSQRAGTDELRLTPWRLAAGIAASRIPEASAVIVTQRWLRLAREDAHTYGDLLLVGGAASRVPSRQCADEIRRLLKQRADSSDNESSKLLEIAVVRMTARLDSHDASGIVEQLAADHAQDSAPSRWLEGMWRAASCVEPEEADACARRWCESFKAARSDEERAAWLPAITEASARSLPSSAGALVEYLISELNSTRSDSERQKLLSAARSAAERTAMDDVLRLVKKWVSVCKHDDGDTEDDWRDVIESAAGRVRPQDSKTLIDWLLQEWTATTKWSMKGWLPSVIAAAARHAQSHEAGLLLEQFLALEAAAPTEYLADRWSVAIQVVTTRMPADDAVSWIHRAATVRSVAPSKVDWLIPFLAECITENDAAILIRDWIDRWVNGGPERYVWRDAIRAALRGVGAQGAADVCRRLLVAGLVAESIALACRVGNVALLRQGASVRAWRADLDQVEVRERDDASLILDLSCELAPPLVRGVLGNVHETAVPSADATKPVVGDKPWVATPDAPRAQLGEHEYPSPRLKSRELRVLEYIRSCEDRDIDAPTQEAIGLYVHRSADAARLICLELERRAGLIHRPDGARSGYRLTAAGRAFFHARLKTSE